MSSQVKLTERVQKLKEDIVNLVHTKYRIVKELTVLDDEKVRREPLVIRKALGLALLLDETPAIIMDDELIVGLRTIYGSLREDESEFDGDFVISKTKFSRFYYPHYAMKEEMDETKRLGGTALSNLWLPLEGFATAHNSYGVQKVLKLGFGGIEEQAKKVMRKLEKSPIENLEKINFLRAVIITLQAASRFAVKYADEAEHLAKETTDLKRRVELRKIRDICCWVSINPPRTFYEALQLFWFGYLIQHIENYYSGPIGRFDQNLYPFYEKDIKECKLTREQAIELLECLFIKFCDEDDLTTDTHANIMLSGQDSDGNDSTNELTYMCLDVAVALKLADPKINVRFHKSSPPELLKRCCEIIKNGGIGGFPSLYNDEALIPAIQGIGIPLRDALLYANDGCQETTIPGKGDFYPIFASINLLGTLNSVLKRNIEWNTFNDLIEDYKKEIASTIKIAVDQANVMDSVLPKISPVPFLSATLEGCIENAKDKTEGGATYNYSGFLGEALANTANSLAVIKRLIYDDGVISMATLRDALASNWEGYERLRQLVINRVPKYGNDNNYVDSLAVEVADFYIREVLKYSNIRGGRFYPGFYVFLQVYEGKNIGASADGRWAGDAISIHASPTVGTDRSGPTSVINSVSKICKLLPPEGAPLDIRLHPSALSGEEGTEKLLALIKTYMDQGGMQLQFNIVDSKVLRDAQKHPEQYKNLIVRVWGFSAYFVTLTPEYQENIIARAQHIV